MPCYKFSFLNQCFPLRCLQSAVSGIFSFPSDQLHPHHTCHTLLLSSYHHSECPIKYFHSSVSGLWPHPCHTSLPSCHRSECPTNFFRSSTRLFLSALVPCKHVDNDCMPLAQSEAVFKKVQSQNYFPNHSQCLILTVVCKVQRANFWMLPTLLGTTIAMTQNPFHPPCQHLLPLPLSLPPQRHSITFLQPSHLLRRLLGSIEPLASLTLLHG
jgi:hypothetical protein